MTATFAASRRAARVGLSLIALGLLVAGCGGGGGGPPATAPTVSATIPVGGAESVALGTSISITFSRAMDESATQGAFSADPAVACAFSWNAASTTLTCAPDEDLQPDTSYTITIGTAARDAGGTALANAFSFSFSTADQPAPEAPSVTGTDPSDGGVDVSIGTPISVTFSEPMNPQASEAAFSSQPPITCTFGWDATDTTLTCTPESELTPETTYTLTIAASASGADGTPLGAPHEFSFTTAPEVTQLCVFGTARFGACRLGP